MPQYNHSTTKVKIVPRDGELEITLNINITLNGELTGNTGQSANNLVAQVNTVKETKETSPLLPDFTSGVSLNFGKKE